MACRTWVRTGVFKMADIRGVSLAAHAAAREAEKGSAACLAARAAGQAVATAHVAQHAFGAAIYALRAVAAADPANAEAMVAGERNWQVLHAPKNLLGRILKTILIGKRRGRISITICRGKDF